MKIGVIANINIENALALTDKIIEHIGDKAELEIEEITAEGLGKEGKRLEDMQPDILVTVGGDGTVLRALQRTDCKVFSINAGVLGFLTEVPHDSALTSLDRILEGDYLIDRRMRLKTTLNGTPLYDCTNEAVIHTSHVAKIRRFKILLDEKLVADVRADGMIIATPTGSTCYAMSVGGPLLDPRVNALVIAPIAPFKLSARPYVVPSESEIKIELLEPNRPCTLVLDGQFETEVSNESEMLFTASKKPAKLVRFTSDFYKRVSEKLIL